MISRYLSHRPHKIESADSGHCLEHGFEILLGPGRYGKDLVLDRERIPSRRPKSSHDHNKRKQRLGEVPSFPHLALTAWNFRELPRFLDIILLCAINNPPSEDPRTRDPLPEGKLKFPVIPFRCLPIVISAMPSPPEAYGVSSLEMKSTRSASCSIAPLSRRSLSWGRRPPERFSTLGSVGRRR